MQTATYVAGIRGVAVSAVQPVGVDPNGQLGIRASAARFKEAIKPMNRDSEVILSLQPVSFRYNKELDPKSTPQFGLVAEEVAKVSPDLVVTNEEGKPFTVRYEEVNAMLLNEFLKEHRKVAEQAARMESQDRRLEEQEATIAQLKSTLAQQQKDMAVFAATLKEQATRIQKVSAQLALSKPAPQTVLNN
jgi:uncharacterized coiled-coil protein SlyX